MQNFVPVVKENCIYIFPAAEGVGYACGHRINGDFFLHKI